MNRARAIDIICVHLKIRIADPDPGFLVGCGSRSGCLCRIRRRFSKLSYGRILSRFSKYVGIWIRSEQLDLASLKNRTFLAVFNGKSYNR